MYIGNDKIGEVNFLVIDESMGAIGGPLVTYNIYKAYQEKIQRQCEEKGISNVEDFNYRILLDDNFELNPLGGIGITDFKDIGEIYVESAGLDHDAIRKIKTAL